MTEINELTDLGSGYGLEQKIFPGGKSLDQFSRENVNNPDLQISPSEVHERVFEQSLNKEVDVNKTFFSVKPLKNKFIVDAQTEHAKKINNQPFDQSKIDLYKQRFMNHLPVNPALKAGVGQTGSFPIDLSTGNVIIPDNIKEGVTVFPEVKVSPLQDDGTFAEPVTLFDSVKTYETKDKVVEKANQEYRLINWTRTQKGGPTNPDALTALARAFRPSLNANFARRVYEALGGTNEIFRFYMPMFMQGIVNKYFGDGSDIIPQNFDSELQTFRSVGMDKYLPDTDRHRIVNDIIREELKKTLPAAEFERRGYGKTKKVMMDGEEVTVPLVNFVTPDFANNLFEYSFDEMGFFDQLAVIIGENTIGTKIITAPIRGAGYIGRLIGNTKRMLSKADAAPFSALSLKEQALQAKKYAEKMNVSPIIAAKEMLLKEKNDNFVNRFFINKLARRIGRKSNKIEFDSSMQTQKALIKDKQIQLEDAIRANKPDVEIQALENQLKILNQEMNWKYVQKIGAELVDFGINPKADLALGLIQYGGRQLYGPVGEAFSVGSVILFGGVKGLYGTARNKFGYGGLVPFSSYLSSKATQAKLRTEDFLDAMISVFNKNPNVTIKGILADPNLRKLNEIVNNTPGLSSTFIKVVKDFSTNAKNLPKEQYDYIIKDMEIAIADIMQITKDLPDAVVAGTNKTVKQTVQDAMSLSVAEMTGINVFASLALALDERATKKMSARSIKRLSGIVESKITNQMNFENRLSILTDQVDQLEGMIIRLESGEFGPISKDVINNLKQTSNSYQIAKAKGEKILKDTIAEDKLEASQLLKSLENPSEGKFINLYTRGEAGEILDKLFVLENRSYNAADNFKEGNFNGDIDVEIYAPSGDKKVKIGKDNEGNITEQPIARAKGKTLTGETDDYNLEDNNFYKDSKLQLETVDTHAINLSNSLEESTNRLNLTSTDKQYINNLNSDVISYVTLIKKSNEFKVKNAYRLISTDKKVRFDKTASSIIDVINSLKVGDESLASVAIFGRNNPLGTNLVKNINGGVKRSLISFFDQPEFLEEINRSGLLGGKTFNTGMEVFDELNITMQKNPDLFGKFAMGKDGPTPLQMAMALIESKVLPFDAEDFNLLSSPYELEQIRQGMLKLSRTSPNPNVKNLASRIISTIDADAGVYEGALSIDDFNAMVRARIINRLSKQRFDKGTVGFQIDQATDLGSFKFIGIDGDEVSSKNLKDLFSPLLNAINKPSAFSEQTINQEFKKILATFLSTTEQLPDNLVRKGPDGRIIMPSESEIADFVRSPVFDLTTREGKKGFILLNKTVSALLKANFVEEKYWKRNIKIVNDIAAGKEPTIQFDQFGSVQPFKFPPGFKNINEYIDTIEDALNVQVKIPDKTSPSGFKIVDVSAVNVRNVFDIDNQVMNTVMSSKKFEEEHKIFFDMMSKQKAKADLSLDTLQKEGDQFFQRTALYKDNITGETFYSTILNSGDPLKLENYISDLDGLVLKGPNNGGITPQKRDEILKGLYISTLNAAGGKGKTSFTSTYYNGQTRTVESYATPDEALELLTGSGIASDNLKILATQAGITVDQQKTFEALFRQGVRIDPSNLVARAKKVATDAGTNAGFSLTNTLSKGFNLARGLVSKEYVAADYAIRYAALANNAILNAVLNDSKAAKIIYNAMTDPSKLIEGDGTYMSRIIASFISTELNKLGINHETGYDKRRYWESKGVVYEGITEIR